MKTTVSMTINGTKYTHDVEPRLLLVHYIRELAGLTGTHVGCDTSQCGACTVHVNGQAVKSCTLLAVQCEGAELKTIEGMAQDGKLHPIQEGFWEKHGLQCGFCTPGMIMSAAQLLERNPKPTEERDPPLARGQPLPLHGLPQYRQGHRVGRREDGGEVGGPTMATARLFGASIKRREDPRFITGKGNYTDDLKLAGMTYAAFVRSPHAHARIRSIDVVARDARIPGVVAVFTGKDMTGVNSLPCGWDLRKEKNIPGVVQDLAMVPHMPLTSDVARHVGDPVAVVIADSQDAASDAAEQVAVDWEVLPSVTATDGAAQRRAPPRSTRARRATSPSSGSWAAATSTPPSRRHMSSSRSAS